MRWIDRYAYNNRIRRLDPAVKAGFSLAVILVCLGFDRPVVSIAALILNILLSVSLAGLPLGSFLKILTGEAAFLVLSIISIAVSFVHPPTAESASIFPVKLLMTRDSVLNALNLLLRTLACVSAMNFLSMTTPIVDLIDLARRLRVPEIIIDLMTLIYRFIFTLFDCLERMIAAKESRLGFRSFRTAFRSAGEIAANLFLETYRKSQKLQLSLDSRCWDGTFRVIPQTYAPIRSLWGREPHTEKRNTP